MKTYKEFKKILESSDEYKDVLIPGVGYLSQSAIERAKRMKQNGGVDPYDSGYNNNSTDIDRWHPPVTSKEVAIRRSGSTEVANKTFTGRVSSGTELMRANRAKEINPEVGYHGPAVAPPGVRRNIINQLKDGVFDYDTIRPYRETLREDPKVVELSKAVLLDDLHNGKFNENHFQFHQGNKEEQLSYRNVRDPEIDAASKRLILRKLAADDKFDVGHYEQHMLDRDVNKASRESLLRKFDNDNFDSGHAYAHRNEFTPELTQASKMAFIRNMNAGDFNGRHYDMLKGNRDVEAYLKVNHPNLIKY